MRGRAGGGGLDEGGLDEGGLLILKMGSTLPSLRSRKGDFEDWIIEGLGLARGKVRVVDVPGGEPLPSLDGHFGIVITGSHAMVTERKDWSERAADWLRHAVREEKPMLGICYGHQLLAHALGGEVGDNPKGREFGTVEVALDEAARDDKFMGNLPSRIRVHVGHTQSVLRLPPGAVRLASNPWDVNQAVRFGAHTWGVQFHPEFDSEIVREYIEYYSDVLSAEGQDSDRLVDCTTEDSSGRLVLRRFAELVRAGA
ncbi:MAG: glutamine amidotransferase [Spirochaetia bacterium]|jgi:GMP synthase (glutamine-hydrolysing)